MKISRIVSVAITVLLVLSTVVCLVYGLISISKSVNGCGEDLNYSCVVECSKTIDENEISFCNKEQCKGCLVYVDKADNCDITNLGGVVKTICVERGTNENFFKAVMFLLAAVVAGISSFYCIKLATFTNPDFPRDEFQSLL